MFLVKPKISPSEISAIVCDVDGTLLDSSHKIHPLTCAALLALQQKHPLVHIIISTGKQYNAVKDTRDAAGLQHFAACHLNGSVIYRDQKVIKQVALSLEYVLRFHDHFLPLAIDMFFYTDDMVYHVLASPNAAKFDEVMLKYGEIVEKAPADFIEQLRKGTIKIIKVTICQDPLDIGATRTMVQEKLGEGIVITSALDFCIEMISAEATKGHALVYLLDLLQISPDRVICFGDGSNDESMFKVAKYSCAMGNAVPSAKALATHQILSNDEGGVGVFLSNLFSLGI